MLFEFEPLEKVGWPILGAGLGCSRQVGWWVSLDLASPPSCRALCLSAAGMPFPLFHCLLPCLTHGSSSERGEGRLLKWEVQLEKRSTRQMKRHFSLLPLRCPPHTTHSLQLYLIQLT